MIGTTPNIPANLFVYRRGRRGNLTMKFRYIYPLIFFIGCFCCNKTTTINQENSATVNNLDKNKLMAMLDDVLADDKLGGELKYYYQDVEYYKTESVSRYDEEYDMWHYGPWSISQKSENEYKMTSTVLLSDEVGLMFEIEFSTQDKYIAKDWRVIEFEYSVVK